MPEHHGAVMGRRILAASAAALVFLSQNVPDVAAANYEQAPNVVGFYDPFAADYVFDLRVSSSSTSYVRTWRSDVGWVAWGTQGRLAVSAASQVIDFEPPVLPGVPNEHDYLVDASASPIGSAWCEPDSGGNWSQVANSPVFATYKYTPLWVASGENWDGASEGVPIMGIRGSDGALMYGLTSLSQACPVLSTAFTTVGYTPGLAGGSVVQTGTGVGNQVFTVFTDAPSGGNLAYAAYSTRYGLWGSWSTINLGVKSVDAVSAAETSAGGFINVFYRGTDGNVWYDAYSNNNAQGTIYHPNGVSLVSGPGCAGTGSYLLCAVVGYDLNIWADLWIGGWQGWINLGSPF